MPKLINLETRQAIWADLISEYPVSQIASKHGVSREFVRKLKMRQLQYEKLNPNLYRITIAVKVLGFHNLKNCRRLNKDGSCSLLSESLDFSELQKRLGDDYSKLKITKVPVKALGGDYETYRLEPWPELCALCGHPETLQQLMELLKAWGLRFK
jgi:hypothetical protein